MLYHMHGHSRDSRRISASLRPIPLLKMVPWCNGSTITVCSTITEHRFFSLVNIVRLDCAGYRSSDATELYMLCMLCMLWTLMLQLCASPTCFVPVNWPGGSSELELPESSSPCSKQWLQVVAAAAVQLQGSGAAAQPSLGSEDAEFSSGCRF